MSEYDEGTETQDESEKVGIPKADLQRLRELARRTEKAERRLAFAEAGIPLGDPRARYFVNGYDGEVAAEAIKSAWEADFGSSPSPEPEAPPVPAAEQAAHQRLAAAAAGSDPPKTTFTPDEIARANSPEEVMALLRANAPDLIFDRE